MEPTNCPKCGNKMIFQEYFYDSYDPNMHCKNCGKHILIQIEPIKHIAELAPQAYSSKQESLDKNSYKYVTPNTEDITPGDRVPMRHQKEAIHAAIQHFQSNSRGLLNLPCGTGKTLTSIWIADKITTPAAYVVVFVPSIALIRQSIKEWSLCLPEFRYLCVCSDDTIDRGLEDVSPQELISSGVSVTTDVEAVCEFFSVTTTMRTIVFSTYHSARILGEAAIQEKIIFDFGLFDEAHRTTGYFGHEWGYALENTGIPIMKRMFMTATPRICSPQSEVPVLSMDDKSVYGETFYSMSLAEAIKQNIIVDYELLVMGINDDSIKDIIDAKTAVNYDPLLLMRQVALLSAIKDGLIKKVVTYHSRVSSARDFVSEEKGMAILQEHLGISIPCWSISSDMPGEKRRKILEAFSKAESGILSNAKCLTEGIDAPDIDCVAFLDPKKSPIDIVQIVGRALRKSKDNQKTKGKIFIPIVTNSENSDVETKFAGERYDIIWEVINCLADQDTKLGEALFSLQKNALTTRSKHPDNSEDLLKLKLGIFPVESGDQFLQGIYTQLADRTKLTWEFMFRLYLDYVQQFGTHKIEPSAEHEGVLLGNWVHRQKLMFQKKMLLEYRIALLETIKGFKWGNQLSNLQNLLRDRSGVAPRSSHAVHKNFVRATCTICKKQDSLIVLQDGSCVICYNALSDTGASPANFQKISEGYY